MAMHGVLFLDELPEFDRRVLEVLREPMESGRVSVSRAARQAEFPARFQLVGAMNPCPCGFLGHYSHRCRCTPDQIARYRARISGPLLDRIDLQIEVPAVAPEDLARSASGDASARIRSRASAARERQLARQGTPNALIQTREIDRHCAPDEHGAQLLSKAIGRLGLSARGYHRVSRSRARSRTSPAMRRCAHRTLQRRFNTGAWIEGRSEGVRRFSRLQAKVAAAIAAAKLRAAKAC